MDENGEKKMIKAEIWMQLMKLDEMRGGDSLKIHNRNWV